MKRIGTTREKTARVLVAAGATCVMAGVLGCATGQAPLSNSNATGSTGAKLVQGTVHGGMQPVVGALIQVYEIGQSGYTGAAKPILSSTVTTNGAGAFSISGKYTCDPGAYVYITAAGGNPGGGVNNNLALMAALGSCSVLNANAASTFISINEVTTVAAAYALGQFSGGTAFGTTLVSKPGSNGVTAAADNFTTSATNVQGVANAMAVAAVLANTSTGTSPGNNTNASATPEYWTVNTVADILSSCVNSVGGAAGDGTACGKLFTGTTPTGGAAPADTIQAALEFALHPGDANLLAGSPSGSTLDALITPQPPYLPYVNTTATGNSINDWTIGINYSPTAASTPLLGQTSGIAIDGYGNAWVTNLANKAVVELAPNGDPIQAGTTAGQYAVNSYSVSGTATPVTAGGNATAEMYGIAIDNENNAFASDYGGGNLFEITGSGASFGTSGEIATHNGGGGTAAPSFNLLSTGAHPVGIAIDGNDNVWTALYGNGGTSPAGGTGCGSYTSGTKNIMGFLKSGGTYGTAQIGSGAGSNQTMIAIDSGSTDTAGGSAIAGSPFIWWIAEASASGETHPSGGSGGHYGLLFQAYDGTTGDAPQGCNSDVGSITSAGYTGSATSKIAQNANGGDTTDLMNNAFAVGFDHSNNLWTMSQLPVDANGTYTASFTKLTPGYGASFSSPNFVSSTTYATYNTGGITAIKPLFLAIDGSGSVWAPNNSGSTKLAAVTNTGVGIAPSTGFSGAVYSPDGITSMARTHGASEGVAVDGSGNVWVSNGTSGSTNVVQVVGVATPVATPLAAGVKNNELGAKP